VETDVICGYVSIERAREDYGVIIEPETLKVDLAATIRLRAEKGIGSG
jgi:N-methylhydantoinase B